MVCNLIFKVMIVYQKYGKNLLDEFSKDLLNIKNNLKKEFGDQIAIINVRYSPAIAQSSSSEISVVEVNSWQIKHSDFLIGHVISTLEIEGNFYYIEFKKNYNS